jgi:LuxR family maltose regulon positive regulatory protein
MAALLRIFGKQPNASDYLLGLLGQAGGPRPSTRQQLIEPLSERELDVLRLLGGDLDGPDIARQLSISINTVRTHTKSIYAKLGVTSRRAAVRQARDINLIPG